MWWQLFFSLFYLIAHQPWPAVWKTVYYSGVLWTQCYFLKCCKTQLKFCLETGPNIRIGTGALDAASRRGRGEADLAPITVLWLWVDHFPQLWKCSLVWEQTLKRKQILCTNIILHFTWENDGQLVMLSLFLPWLEPWMTHLGCIWSVSWQDKYCPPYRMGWASVETALLGS